MFAYEIQNFSNYDPWNIHGEETNYSDIMDKLIRLTAKITEHYASDIFYDLKSIDDHIRRGEEFHLLLVFREYGVNSYVLKYDDFFFYPGWFSEEIQDWVFDYVPGTRPYLHRVNLMHEKYAESEESFLEERNEH
jgi:hypothetical protein